MAIGIVVAALVGVGAGFAGGYLSRSSPAAQTREFYVFTWVVPFDEALVGQPPDAFMPNALIVNRGDTVLIRFYNTEDIDEDHSFTMDAPYAVDQTVNWQQSANITFVAGTPGVFKFWCKFHLPSMTGSLTVLG